MNTNDSKPNKPKRQRKNKGRKPEVEKSTEKVETKSVEVVPQRPNYLAASMLRPEILEQFGRRAARIIGDAAKGDIIVTSVAWYHVSTGELASMHEAGIITGGFNDKGVRDSSPIVCNV